MRLVCVVSGEWSAAAVDRLANTEPADTEPADTEPADTERDGIGVQAVIVTGARADQAWRKRPASRRLPVLRETSVAELDTTAVDAVLLIGGLVAPPWLGPALAGMPTLVATATSEDGLAVTDPVHWCVRNGHRRLHLRVHRAGPDLTDLHEVAAVALDLSGLDYRAGVEATVNALARLLPSWPVGPSTPADGASGRDDLLGLERAAMRIDWAAPAGDIVRLVRSGAGRTTSAWTYLNGFPIAVERAKECDGGANIAPGTIVRQQSDGAVVQSGAGMVCIGEVRDSVGVMPIGALRPGLRFGLDVEEELASLRRRVADLERTITWLVNESGARAMSGDLSWLANPTVADG